MPKDTYVKELKILTKIDEQALRKTQKDLENAYSSSAISKNILDEYNKNYRKIFEISDKLKKNQDSINTLKGFENYESKKAIQQLEQENKLLNQQAEIIQKSDYFKNIFAKKDETKSSDEKDKLEDTVDKFGKYGKDFSKQMLDNFLPEWISSGAALADSLKQIFDKAITLLKSSLNEMSSASLLTNTETRETMFKYGFNQAQAYAFNRTLGIMGLDEESMWFMEPWQQERFLSMVEDFSSRYTELYDTGFFKDYLELQYQWQEVKEDLKFELVGFVVNNKELILGAMKAALAISKILLDIFNVISKVFRFGTGLMGFSDIMSSQTWNNRNIKIDNTYNITGKVNDSVINDVGNLQFKNYILANDMY